MDTYLYGMNEALVERQGDYIEGKVPHAGLRVEKALQHLLEVELHDRTAHARRDVTHLLQVFLLRHLLPCNPKK